MILETTANKAATTSNIAGMLILCPQKGFPSGIIYFLPPHVCSGFQESRLSSLSCSAESTS